MIHTNFHLHYVIILLLYYYYWYRRTKFNCHVQIICTIRHTDTHSCRGDPGPLMRIDDRRWLLKLDIQINKCRIYNDIIKMKVGMAHMKIKCTYIIIMITTDNQAVRQILFSGIFLFFRSFFCEQNVFSINLLFKSMTVTFLFHFFPFREQVAQLIRGLEKGGIA